MIKELLQSIQLTPQEQAIVQYMNQHPDALFHYNAKELAKEAYVSSPTVIRFVKKLGFKGFLDFQKTYIQEYSLHDVNNASQITSESSIKDIINSLPAVYEKVFFETQKMAKQDPFVRTINYMLQAKQIDFYANDNNYSEVQSACLKLNALGIRAQVFNTLNQDYTNALNPSETLSFVVSHSGNNQTMIDVAYFLRKRRSRVIAITGRLDPSLELICNESLYVDTSLHHLPSGMKLYGLSIHYILDILIATLMIKTGKI